jgi:hypothetical protein
VFFARKKRGLRNQRKFLSIKAKASRGRALKNVLTEKRAFFGAIWQKNGGAAPKKRHFFSCFFDFLGFFAPQEVEAEDVPPIRLLQKKSCLKTYGRFLGFCGLW